MYTLPPASEPTAMPYPAYGTPVPGVGAGAPVPGVPQRISLTQASAVGYARSPALASARADIGVAAALVRLQRAGLLPSVSGQVSSSRVHSQIGSVTQTTSTAGNPQVSTGPLTSTSNSLSATVRQLVYDGGRVAAGVRAAQRTETAFADTYRRDLQTVAFNVATSYYNYLAAQRTTAVDVELVHENQVQLDLVNAQFGAGTASHVDVVTAQLPVAQARLAVVQAQGAELAAQAAFANAMGLDADANVQPIDDTPVSPTAAVSSLAVPTYTQSIARALALRPDYDSSAQSVASAQYSLKQARLGLFPSLGAAGQAQTASTDPGGGAFRNSSSIGLTLTIPIYDQGITAANTAQGQANLDKANAGLQSTKLGVQLSVKQSLTNLVSAQAALDQSAAALANASEVLRSTQAQYRAGVTTLPLLLNAQVGMTQALTSRVTTIYNLRLAEQQYLYATGEIGQS
jgi:outer membrane protein TolC